MRGILVSASVEAGSDGVLLDASLPKSLIRRCVTYWDQIAYPVVNGFGPNLSDMPELEFLISAGVLSLPDVSIPVNCDESIRASSPIELCGMPIPIIPFVVTHVQYQLANQWLARGQIWNIQQLGRRPWLAGAVDETRTLLEMQLLEFLPVPTDDVGIPDILEFRSKRWDELNCLRVEIDSIRASVLQSDEPFREIARAGERIRTSTTAIARLMHESKLRTFLDAIKLYTTLDSNSLILTGLGAAGGAVLGNPAVGGVIGMIANVGIQFAHRLCHPDPSVPSSLAPYIYVNSVDKNLRNASSR